MQVKQAFTFILVLLMVQSLLAADKAYQLTIYNKGIGGQNSSQGKKRFKRDVLNLKPNYVFIYFGLNDTLNERKFLSEQQYVENITWMIDQANKANIIPVLCTIHPVTEAALLKRHKKESYGAEGPNGKIVRYNKALIALAKQKQVKLADFASVIVKADKTGEKLLSDDGVHLTPEGYKALANCLFNTIKADLKGEITIVCLGDSVTWGAGVKGPGKTTGESYPAYLNSF